MLNFPLNSNIMKKSTTKNTVCGLLSIIILLAGCSPQPNSLDRKVFKA